MSVICGWEIEIEPAQGKLDLRHLVRDLFIHPQHEHGFRILPIELRHPSRMAGFAKQHDDLFGHMLIAQALDEELTLATRDQLRHADPVACYG